MLERKSWAQDGLQLGGGEHGSFLGHPSIFGNKDRDDEIIEPGAFKNLDSFLKDGFGAVAHVWGGLPIATIEEAKQDERGLFIRADFHSHGAAQDARKVMGERLARGKSVPLSIGYKVLDDDRKDGVRHLKALDLYEVSFVTVPANPLAGAAGVKSAEEAGGQKNATPSPLLIPGNGMLAENTERVKAALEDLTEGWKAVRDAQSKEGRVLSSARRERLRSAHDTLIRMLAELGQSQELIAELLTETEPPSRDELGQLAARLQASRARGQGLNI